MKKMNEMNTWGSVVTPNRARELGSIVARIEQFGVTVLNRQVGNVISDLRVRGGHDLADDLRQAIQEYNAEVVERHNKEVDFVMTMKGWLKRRGGHGEVASDAYGDAFPYGLLAAADMYNCDLVAAQNAYNAAFYRAKQNR